MTGAPGQLSGPDECAAFRNELRNAREACGRDAEAFDEILFVVERLGCRLHGRLEALNLYKPFLARLAAKSALVAEIDNVCPSLPNFGGLFDVIRLARNEALHQGAVARLLTTRVTELALVLEDALASEFDQVRYFMVKSPVVAEPWQTLAAIRQVMLANAFSHLPIFWAEEWRYVSDHALARYLRRPEGRKSQMAKLLREVLGGEPQGEPFLIPARSCLPETSVDDVVRLMDGGLPVLVLDGDGERLVGLVSPADIL